jgi:hypothetical protein
MNEQGWGRRRTQRRRMQTRRTIQRDNGDQAMQRRRGVDRAMKKIVGRFAGGTPEGDANARL